MLWFWKKLEAEVYEKQIIPKPGFTEIFEKSFFKKTIWIMCEVWAVGVIALNF